MSPSIAGMVPVQPGRDTDAPGMTSPESEISVGVGADRWAKAPPAARVRQQICIDRYKITEP